MSNDTEKLTAHLTTDAKDVQVSVKDNESDEGFFEVALGCREDIFGDKGPSKTKLILILSALVVVFIALFALLRRSKGE